MVSIEFWSVGPGTCMWCRREKDEVLTVAFSDQSFVGPLCRGDFMKALGTKLLAAEAKSAAPAPTSAGVGADGVQ